MQIDNTTDDKEEKVKFADKYYSSTDRTHAEIMEAVAKPCYSKKKGFKETDKIEAIRKLLEKSAYKELYIDSASVWYKGDLMKLINNPCYLVSSHADLVSQITKPYSKLDDDGYYKGTYDNNGTNAAAVIAMLEGDLPNNVIFTFTSEEESGHYTGARDTVSTLKAIGIRNITTIVLDVTYEGYDEGMLASVENCSKNDNFLNKVADAAMSVEPEDQSFCFVRISKKAVPDNLDEKYISTSTGMPDEAFYYTANLKLNSFSLCLPCKGSMHSNAGVTVRQPVFEGYVKTLEGMLYSFTKTHHDRIWQIIRDKQELLDREKELLEDEAKKTKLNYWGSPVNYTTGRQYEFTDYNTFLGAYNDYLDEDLDEDDMYRETTSLPIYGADYAELINEVVACNIEHYSEEEKESFISDAIAQISPDLFEQYNNLYNYLENEFEGYQQMLRECDEGMEDYPDASDYL